MKYTVKFADWKDEYTLGQFNDLEEAKKFANQQYDELIWDEYEEDVIIYDENDNRINY